MSYKILNRGCLHCFRTISRIFTKYLIYKDFFYVSLHWVFHNRRTLHEISRGDRICSSSTAFQAQQDCTYKELFSIDQRHNSPQVKHRKKFKEYVEKVSIQYLNQSSFFEECSGDFRSKTCCLFLMKFHSIKVTGIKK